jgi:hypothetical protein
MFNWNRTVVDSLVITFAPTCSSIVDPINSTPAIGNATFDATQGSLSILVNNLNPNQPVNYGYTIQLPDFPQVDNLQQTVSIGTPAGSAQTTSKLIDVSSSANAPTHGIIQWTGYLAPGVGKQRYEVHGSIMDPLSGNVVGSATLTSDVPFLTCPMTTPASGTPIGCPPPDGKPHYYPDLNYLSSHLFGQITPGLYETLSGNDATSNYWSTIQSCSLATGAQRQNQVQNTTNINNLFKLNNTERQRLLQ